MKDLWIPTLSVYSDWLEKAKYELLRFEKSCGVYDMANCFLTLNAIPEWIDKSDDAPSKLKELAISKIAIMKGKNFDLDENRLGELDHQLRLIRLFCNHSKHGDPKEKLEHMSMSAFFPLTFPVKFEFLSVGHKSVKVFDLLQSVINFWSSEMQNT
jgi:hypothetical protein